MTIRTRRPLTALALVCAAGWALMAAPAAAQAQASDTPQYGGTLTTSTVNPTISALTWDQADWNWKFNQDTGQVYEMLFAADLTQARHLGGKYGFTADAWIPPDAVRGELAESWVLKENPLRAEIKLRKGVMFPERPGVMKARELTAQDVVDSFNRYQASPKRIVRSHEHIEKAEAPDKYTVVFKFKYYLGEWQYRFGYGYYSAIVPNEVAAAGAANWKNANGTGPFMLTDVVQSTSNTYDKNPNYWDKITVGGKDYKLPFVDKLVYRLIKDESTLLASFRTGKIDLLEAVRWSAADDLKKSASQAKWSRWLSTRGTFLAMRVDRKPFDDVRVRRALNMAVNKQEIVKSFYSGNAELLGYPQHPDYVGYYEPLDKMPASVKELYTYDPDKAKKLLAEAGYPKGFSFKVQYCSCAPDHVDLLPLIAAYLEQVGVKVELQPMEYAAFLSAMTTHNNEAGYFMDSGHTNPTVALRKNFESGSLWNPAQYADAAFDKRLEAASNDRDEAGRQLAVRELTREILDKAPFIWLPTQYAYTFWWPWVKNYGGELRAGAERPGPIYARIWLDQALKKKMGY
ncbi:MAG: ABC transporter substrate-binding protein [Burkholderiaceae bacterium]